MDTWASYIFITQLRVLCVFMYYACSDWSKLYVLLGGGKLIENCSNKYMNICKKNHNMRKYPLNGNRPFYCCFPGLW